MVESLSKLALFFRVGGGGGSGKSKSSQSLNFNSNAYQFPERENKPAVIRSPILRHRRWASYHNQRRLLKDQNRMVTGGNTGSCSLNKAPPLKPLVDHGRSTTEICKSSVKTKMKPSAAQICKINPLLSQLKYTTNGMEAFIILLQKITADRDVFALPYIKRELTKYKSEWLEMKLKLEEANVSCKRLKEEIEMQNILHENKLEELREIHSNQLNTMSECNKQELGERSESYEKQIRELEEKLRTQENTLQTKFNDELRTIQKQAEQRLESILEGTKNQVEMLKTENETWKEKMRVESKHNLEQMETKLKQQMEQIENKYEKRLEEAADELRKKEEQFVSFSNKRVENILKRKLSNDSNLEEKHNSESLIPHGFKLEFQNLEEEVCSLRTVLDLKHSEIQDLRKQNEKLHRDVQDLPFVLQKLDSAQARVEDLNAQMAAKVENEKKLLRENRKLMDALHSESEKKKRLTFHNEELLWKLKRSTQVAKTLAVFSSGRNKEETVSESEVIYHSTPANPKYCPSQLDTSLRTAEKSLKRSRTDNDLQPIESPTEGDVSSKVLGVVEKNDSVSWVLEIDEPPIAVASRMLRRASSLRGVPSKKKSNHNRQLLTLPVRNKKYQSVSDECAATVPTKRDLGIQCCKSPPSSEENKADKKMGHDDGQDEADNISVDISNIFDFLRDSDCDTDTPLNEGEDLKSPFSCSDDNNSTEGSMDLEDVFEKEDKPLTYRRRLTWNEGTMDTGVGNGGPNNYNKTISTSRCNTYSCSGSDSGSDNEETKSSPASLNCSKEKTLTKTTV